MFKRIFSRSRRKRQFANILASEIRTRNYHRPYAEQLEDRRMLAPLLWQGDVNDDWSEPGNWNLARSPLNGDSLIFSTESTGFDTTSGFASNNDISGLSNLIIQIVDSSAAGDFVIGGNPVSLANSSLVHNQTVASGNTQLNLDITLQSDIQIIAGTLQLAGVVSGSNGLTKSGSGALMLANSGNNYVGTTTIAFGTLQLDDQEVIPDTSVVHFVGASSKLLLEHNATTAPEETIAGLTGPAGVVTGPSIGSGARELRLLVPVGVTHDFGGIMVSGGGLLSLNKDGRGTQTLNQGAFYSATVNQGRLSINGTLQSSGGGDVTVNSGGVLGGTGTIDRNVISNAGGTIAPGNSPGSLGTQNLTLGGSYGVELGGTTAGDSSSDHDQLVVTGTVDISAGTLLSISSTGGFVPSFGDAFTIIDNDGSDAVTGVFADGASGTWEDGEIITNDFLGSGLAAAIFYTGGDGNDIELRIPKTVTWDGGGVDSNWTTPENWLGDVAPLPTDQLAFPSTAAQKTNVNDFAAGTNFGSILFDGGGFHVSGNAIDLAGTISSAGNNTFDIDLKLDSDGGLAASSSTFNVLGDIDNNGFELSFDVATTLNLSGAISGIGDVVIAGTNGSIVLSGDSGYTGKTTVSVRYLYLEHANALGTGSNMASDGTEVTGTNTRIYVRNGISIIDEKLSTATANLYLFSEGDGLTNTWDGDIASDDNIRLYSGTNNRLVLTSKLHPGTGSTGPSHSIYTYSGGYGVVEFAPTVEFMDVLRLVVGSYGTGMEVNNMRSTKYAPDINYGSPGLFGTGQLSWTEIDALEIRSGVLSPGPRDGIGKLTTEDVRFVWTSQSTVPTFEVELNGTTAGSGHDQLVVNGTVELTGELDVSLMPGYTPSVGDWFTVIDNDGTADAVTGTFGGLAEGAIFAVGTDVFSITYVGGDGNDVVIEKVAASVWDGGGADNKWMTPENWNGDVAPAPNACLHFPDTGLQKNNENDFPASTNFSSILITGNGYTMSGNQLSLSASVTSEGSGNTFAIPLAVDTALGLGGNNYDFIASGAISGAGGLDISGSQSVTLSGDNSYAGKTTASTRLNLRHANALGTAEEGTELLNAYSRVWLYDGIMISDEKLTSTSSDLYLRSVGSGLTNVWDGDIESFYSVYLGPESGNRLKVTKELKPGTASGSPSHPIYIDGSKAGIVEYASTATFPNVHSLFVNANRAGIEVNNTQQTAYAPYIYRNSGGLSGSGSLTYVSSDPLRVQGGRVDPGPTDAIGRLTTESIQFNLNGDTSPALDVQLNGTEPGTTHDQLAVNGSVELSGNLNVTLEPGYTPTLGSSYLILENDASDAIVGTFSGLPEGGFLAVGSHYFSITYQGGVDDNDLVLTAVTVNEWDGGGADDNWTTPQNWVGNVAPTAGTNLLFPESAVQKNAHNDFAAGTSFSSIVISGSNYALTGNQVALDNSLVSRGSNNSASLPIAVSSSLGISSDTSTFEVGGQISGSGSISVDGAGIVAFSGDNSYTGKTIVSGKLYLRHDNALGAGTNLAADGTELSSDNARLRLQQGITVTNERLSAPASNLYVESDGDLTNTWAGDLASFYHLFFYPFDAGRLIVTKDLHGHTSSSTSYGGIYAYGSVNATLEIASTATFATISQLVVSGATLEVNNNQPTRYGPSLYRRLSGVGTLNWTESSPTANVYNNGTLDPGTESSFGRLTVGDLKITSTSSTPAVAVKLGGTTAGTNHDQLRVEGSVELSGTLDVTLETGYTPGVGNQFVIIDNDGTDAVVGTFSGLPEGGLVNYGGNIFEISYVGGDGNDVELTANLANSFPVADPQSVSTDEGTAVNITLTGSDADNDPMTFSIDTNPTNGSLSGSGANRTYTPNTNFDGTDTFVFRVTDDKDGFGTAMVTITINAAQDPPTDISLSPSDVNENRSIGSVVGNLTTTDPDTGETFTYSFATGAGDTENGSFTISGDQLLLGIVPDHETKDSYSIRVQTEDSAGATFQKVFAITINDINEAPTALNISSTEVPSGDPVGTVVGTLSTIDQDEGDTHLYDFASGVGDTDNPSFTIEGDQLKVNFVPDHHVKSSYSVRLKSTDQGSECVEQTFNISVTSPVSVRINEVDYDQPGTDDREFIELYNSEMDAVVLTGYTLKHYDSSGSLIHTETLSGSVAAESAFVIGMSAVPNVDQITAYEMPGMSWALSLFDDSNNLLDSVAFGAAVSGQGEGSPAVAEDSVTHRSIGRFADGNDTDDNATDFSYLPATPGAANVDTFAPMLSGTTGADNFVFKRTASAGSFVQVTLGGSEVGVYDLQSLTSLTIDGEGGDDILTIDMSNDNPVPSGSLAFNGGGQDAGGDALVIVGSGGSVVYNASDTDGSSGDGNIDWDGRTITFTGLEPIDLSGSTITDLTINVDPLSNVAGAVTTTIAADSGTNTLVSFDNGLEAALLGIITGTLTINGDDGDDDTIDVNGVGGGFAGGLSIDGKAGTDTVHLNGGLTFSAGKSLNIASDTIELTSGAADISVAGSGSIAVTASRNIRSVAGSTLSSVDGDITLNANQQATQTSGNFYGIESIESTFTTSGNGDIRLSGKGGDTGTANRGIYLNNTLISSTSTGIAAGTITIDGRAEGAGSSIGITLQGVTEIASANGSISLTGVGAGGGRGILVGTTVSFSATAPGDSGNSNVAIEGTGSGSGIGLTMKGTIISDSGTVALISADDLQLTSSASIQSDSGLISLVADNAAGNNGGEIDLADGSQIDAGAGDIALAADSDHKLSTLITTGDIHITSTNGGIVDNTAAEDANITAQQTALRAAAGIGSANGINTAVSTLAARNVTSGNVNINNDVGGLLTVGTVDGLVGVANSATNHFLVVTNASPLTIADDISADGSITLIAADSTATGDDLIINGADAATTGNVEITSTGAAGIVRLEAGDDLTLNSGATVSGFLIQLIGDSGNADTGVGSTLKILGSISSTNETDISGDSDDDTFIVGPDSTTALDIQGGAGSDTVNFDGPVSLTNEDLTVVADTINVNAAVSSGGGHVGLTATGNITISQPVMTGGGSFTANADSDASGSGSFSIVGAASGTPSQLKKLFATDPANHDVVGRAVAISGDVAIVSNAQDDDDASNSGSAMIFSRNEGGVDNWGQLVELTASDSALNDRFGQSVSLRGSLAAVGAKTATRGGKSQVGRAYVFAQNQGGADNWGELAILSPSDGDTNTQFGQSISVDVDHVVVGANGDDENGTNSGAAYIFNKDQGGVDNWGQVKKLTASDGASYNVFGSSVAFSGDTIVVGAEGAGTNLDGAAYIFQRDFGGTNNWGEVAKLERAPSFNPTHFGTSVAILGDFVAVGTPGDDEAQASTSYGAVYLYGRNVGGADNWGLIKKVVADDKANGDEFGTSVWLDVDHLMVGATDDDDNGSNSGSAYLFERNAGGTDNWGQIAKYVPSDGETDDEFGRSVSISNDTVLVGSYLDDDLATNSGAAYLFETPVNTNGSVDTGSGSLSINSNFVELAGDLSGTSTLSIIPRSPGTSIGLGGGPGGLNLSDMELAHLTDGFSAITIGDIASGTGLVRYDTLLFNDPVTIAGGVFNDYSGTDITAPSLTLDGNVSPGQSPGILNIVGNFAFATGDTFTAELGGTTPGEGAGKHDQIAVTGSVTIHPNTTVSFSLFNGGGGPNYAPSYGDTLVLIDNDGVDAVMGTFSDGGGGTWDEGEVISNDFLGTGFRAVISYTGGDGNDVALGLFNTDFGDAPSPYATLLASDGARHDLSTSLTLGENVDHEPDGQPTATADGDDTTGSPVDEDGVTFGTIQVGQLDATVTVNVQGAAGKLDAWIDFNGDGSWGGPGEQIFASKDVVVGNNNLMFDVPSYALAGTTYARFRLSTAGGLGPSGIAADGEVEDYRVAVTGPTSSVGFFGSQQVISTAGDGASAVHAADLDGDGDLDVLAGSEDDATLAWLENDGQQSYTRHTISTTADGPNNVHTGDLDGDGDLDVVVALNFDDRIAWYENDGSQDFTEHTVSAANDVGLLALADLDQDGDLDLVSLPSINVSNEIAWYENDGSGSFTERSVTTSVSGPTSVSVADVDRDGDLDIVATSGLDKKVAWFENDGNQAFTAHTVAILADIPVDAFVSDVDGDGYLDIVSAADYFFGGNALAWHRNDGSQSFTQFTISNAVAGINRLFVSDVDGDGDQDIAASIFHSNKLAWFENDGSQNFTERTITTAAEGVLDLFVADVDGDGDLDVLSASYADDKIAWYPNAIPEFGDAPVPYPTLLADDGAYHDIISGFSLGSEVDSEMDGQPTADADGDDATGAPDDEDGVSHASGGGLLISDGLTRGDASESLEILVTNTAGVVNPYLDAWIDFNQDGDWDDAGEHVISQAVITGTNTVSLAVPDDAELGETYARFRLHSATGPGLDPTGFASEGEVEDHRVLITFDVSSPDQVAKLLSSDIALGDLFGRSVDVSGDTVVVGVPRDDDDGSWSGSAYVFVLQSGVWQFQAKLTASDAAAGDEFGENVAIDGDTIAVGAYAHDEEGSSNTDNGAVYVFTRSGTTWGVPQKLLASDRADDDHFGWSVDVQGDTLLAGARLHNEDTATATLNNGAAYVFTRSGAIWTQQQKLLASDRADYDQFGYTLALDGTTAVIGSPDRSSSRVQPAWRFGMRELLSQ